MTRKSTVHGLTGRLRGLARYGAVIAAAGCASDATEPALPDVNGVYRDVTNVSALTCTPALFNQPAFTSVAVVRVRQNGAQLTVRPLEIDGQNVEHLDLEVEITLDRDGRFQRETVSPWTETTGPQGPVFIQSRFSGTGRFNWTVTPITITGAGTVTEVYREASPTGPLMATCTSQQTSSGTRTGS